MLLSVAPERPVGFPKNESLPAPREAECRKELALAPPQGAEPWERRSELKWLTLTAFWISVERSARQLSVLWIMCR